MVCPTALVHGGNTGGLEAGSELAELCKGPSIRFLFVYNRILAGFRRYDKEATKGFGVADDPIQRGRMGLRWDRKGF